MSNKISFTKVQTYLDCGRKYKLQYLDRLRPKEINSALIFGTAIDDALNNLLLTKDLNKSKEIFFNSFKQREHNGEIIYTEFSPLVSFLETDLDNDLLTNEDRNQKNLAFWSLYRKGLIIIDSYANFILPKIKEVLCVQQDLEHINQNGDIFEGTLDIIVKLNDNKVYLLDHKTSSIKYDVNSAANSIQLATYEYFNDKYKLDGVGFIVLNKNIWKKKTKVCKECSMDGSGTSFRTCNNLINNKRCNSEWDIELDAKCYIDLILDTPVPKVTEMMLEAFDGVNENIKNNIFLPNFNSCQKGKITCSYKNLCYNGDSSDLIQMKKNETKS